MTIFGWDMSHYDEIPAGGGARVLDEGFSFVTHKAGGDANDAELGAWWSAFRGFRGRLLLGAYWVLYPGSPVSRADAFLARLDDKCPGWRDGPFILQVDCEIWNNDPTTKPGWSDIKTFCYRLRTKVPKLMPIVYASEGQYHDQLTGLGFPLWNARYRLGNTPGTASALYARSGGDSGAGWDEYSGQTPAIWQFTASATIAGQTTCDANAFRGTLGQLKALLAPGWTTEDDVALSDDDKTWIHNDIKALLEKDGAVARGLRAQPNNLSDSERTKLTDVIAGRLTPIIQSVDTDETAVTASIVQGVLSGLAGADGAAETIADAVVAALPPDLARQVVDEIGKRLSPAEPNG